MYVCLSTPRSRVISRAPTVVSVVHPVAIVPRTENNFSSNFIWEKQARRDPGEKPPPRVKTCLCLRTDVAGTPLTELFRRTHRLGAHNSSQPSRLRTPRDGSFFKAEGQKRKNRVPWTFSTSSDPNGFAVGVARTGGEHGTCFSI